MSVMRNANPGATEGALPRWLDEYEPSRPRAAMTIADVQALASRVEREHPIFEAWPKVSRTKDGLRLGLVLRARGFGCIHDVPVENVDSFSQVMARAGEVVWTHINGCVLKRSVPATRTLRVVHPAPMSDPCG